MPLIACGSLGAIPETSIELSGARTQAADEPCFDLTQTRPRRIFPSFFLQFREQTINLNASTQNSAVFRMEEDKSFIRIILKD
jgi:hypothetical protein